MAKLDEAIKMVTALEQDVIKEIQLIEQQGQLNPQVKSGMIHVLHIHVNEKITEVIQLEQESKHFKKKDNDPRIKNIEQKIEQIKTALTQLSVIEPVQKKDEMQVSLQDSMPPIMLGESPVTDSEKEPSVSVELNKSIITPPLSHPSTATAMQTDDALHVFKAAIAELQEARAKKEMDYGQKMEQDFNLALNKLEQKKGEWSQEVQKPLDELINHLKVLKQDAQEEKKILIDVLKKTYLLMSQSLSDQSYKRFAHAISDKLSPGLKILGGLMIALSLVVLTVGLAFSSTIGGPLLAVSALAIGSGIAFSLSSFGVFAMKRDTNNDTIPTVHQGSAAKYPI